VEYVSPIDERTQAPKALAPRRRQLQGARVVLLDIKKNRSDEFLDRVEELLRERGAETLREAKATFSRPAASELVEAIAIRADLAVEALAD
jgi:alpha-galactosidase/6-phospho-beta-glucosidase family protein